MAYRPTEQTEARRQAARERIAAAALAQVAEGGYASAGVQAVAARAGWRWAPSTATSPPRPTCSPRSSGAPRSASSTWWPRSRRPTAAPRRGALRAPACEAFCRRALAGPVLAYALLAEPVDPAVESRAPAPPARLPRRVRRACSRTASRRASCARTTPRTVAAALVGALGEALVGPLSPPRSGAHEAARRHPRPVLPERRTHQGDPRDRARAQSTHDVLNQAPPIAPYNVFEADRALGEALEREGGALGRRPPARHGRAGRQRRGARALRARERNEPILRTHDRYGNRIDEVELDPSWHWMLRQAIEREIHSLPWRDPQPRRPHACARRCCTSGARSNSGVMCPVSMTYSVIPALRAERRAGRRVGAAPDLGRLRRAAPWPAWR